MLWFHVGASQRLSRPLLLSGILLYAVALALQLIRQLYVNVNRQLAIGRIKEIDSDGLGSYVIAITPSRRWTVRPGTYALLTVLNWRYASFLQKHPLMVAWVENLDNEETTLYFVVQPRNGWTSCVSNSLIQRLVWLDGLYGNPYDSGSHDLSSHDTVLLVAEENGILAHLLILKCLVEGIKFGAMKTRRIVLYWKASGCHQKIRSWLTAAIRETDVFWTVSLTLHRCLFFTDQAAVSRYEHPLPSRCNPVGETMEEDQRAHYGIKR